MGLAGAIFPGYDDAFPILVGFLFEVSQGYLLEMMLRLGYGMVVTKIGIGHRFGDVLTELVLELLHGPVFFIQRTLVIDILVKDPAVSVAFCRFRAGLPAYIEGRLKVGFGIIDHTALCLLPFLNHWRSTPPRAGCHRRGYPPRNRAP